MRAIVNTSKDSAYSENNGITFQVEKLMSSIVVLNINGTDTDFGHKEVLIVDIQEELQNAFDEKDLDTINNLNHYRVANGIQNITLK